MLSKVVDNNFLLCKIDTLRYELKHCPAPNQSTKEEYNKCCEKLRTIVRTEKENNQNVFYEWENKKFRHGQKTSNSPEEIMKFSEINKVYVKLLNCKKILQMINEKKLF